MQIKILKFIVLLFVFYNAWISAMNPVDDPAIAEIEGEIEKYFNTKSPKDKANQIATIKKLGGLIEKKNMPYCHSLVIALANKINDRDWDLMNRDWDLMDCFNKMLTNGLDKTIASDDSDINKIHFLFALIKEINNRIQLTIVSSINQNFIRNSRIDDVLVFAAVMDFIKSIISLEDKKMGSMGLSMLLDLVKRGKGYDYAKEVIRKKLLNKDDFFNALFNECVEKMSIKDVDSVSDKKLWEKIVEDYNNWYVDVSAVQEQGFIYYKNIKRRNIKTKSKEILQL